MYCNYTVVLIFDAIKHIPILQLKMLAHCIKYIIFYIYMLQLYIAMLYENLLIGKCCYYRKDRMLHIYHLHLIISQITAHTTTPWNYLLPKNSHSIWQNKNSIVLHSQCTSNIWKSILKKPRKSKNIYFI